MSDQLLGAIIGGIFALVGSFGTLSFQQWMRKRGDITSQLGHCDMKMIKTSGEVSSLPNLRSLQEEDLEHVAELQLIAVLRLHNQKDVSVGLMEMYIALLHGRQHIWQSTPNADRILYMGAQEGEAQKPFQAATLPGQQVIIMWLMGVINDEDISNEEKGKLQKCDKAKLVVRLSNGSVKVHEIPRWVE